MQGMQQEQQHMGVQEGEAGARLESWARKGPGDTGRVPILSWRFPSNDFKPRNERVRFVYQKEQPDDSCGEDDWH